MGRIVVSEFVSIDGVMENPAWTQPYWGDEQDAYKHTELFAAAALLLGRVTYEGFAEAWPSVTGEDGYADRINALPKHVASSTPELPAWNGTAIDGDLVAAVPTLREAPGQDILVFGSAQLVQTLTREGLVDEFRLMVYPVVVGSGKKLFQDKTVASLKLVDATTFATGVVVLTYHPAS